MRLIVLSHLHQGDFAAARQAASDLHSTAPDVCDEMLAQVNREERDYQAEVTRLQRIVATTPDPEEAARAQLWTARVHHVFGRVSLAQESYLGVIERRAGHPEGGRAVTHLGQLAIEGKEYARGVSQMEALARRHPKTPAALSARMAIPRIHLAHRKPELAMAAYAALAQRYPNTQMAVDADFAIAKLYEAQGKPDRAVETYTAITTRYPGMIGAEAQVAIAKLYETRGDTDRAIKVYAAATKGYPGTEAAAQARLAIAEIHRKRGEEQKAEAAYLTVARAYRDSSVSHQARDALARMYYARGEAAMAPAYSTVALEASLDAYRRGVHVDPDRDRKSKYSLHVSSLYAGLRRWEEARAAANEVLKLDPPDNPEFAKRRTAARSAIVSYFHQEGRLQEALAGFRGLLAESADPGEKQSLATTIADIESELNPNPLYVETPDEELKEAR